MKHVLFDCQDQLLELFEHLNGVLFCIKDADGRYVYVNDGFLNRSGKTSKRDVIGRRASDIFVPSRAQQYEAQDAHVLTTGASMHDLLELIRRPNGDAGWYVTTKLPVRRDGSVVGIVSMSSDLETPSADDIAVNSLTRVIDHVTDNLTLALRVADLAEVAGCSTGQLTGRFRQVFGLTPAQYVARVRVGAAAALLAESKLAISDVAARCGFTDQAHLTRQFARYTGLTPGQYRSERTDLFCTVNAYYRPRRSVRC